MDEKYYAHLSEDGRKQLELAHLEGTADIYILAIKMIMIMSLRICLLL